MTFPERDVRKIIEEIAATPWRVRELIQIMELTYRTDQSKPDVGLKLQKSQRQHVGSCVNSFGSGSLPHRIDQRKCAVYGCSRSRTPGRERVVLKRMLRP